MISMTSPAPRAAAFAAALLVALPAVAQTDEPGPRPEAEGEALGEAARRALENLLQDLRPVLDALRATIEDLPRYGPPEIQPDGDILIPRLDEPEPEPAPEPDSGDADRPERLDL
ncbi:MAG TPA: hypothetical protein VJ994_12295 [Paracoccaceae bacterium]|nr:hypothetical protein [Paracoccaceae bacterium]